MESSGGINMPKGKAIKWSNAQLKKIRKQYPNVKNVGMLSNQLGVPYSALKSLAKRLHLKRKRRTNQIWLHPMLKILRKLYPTTTNKIIAKKTGFTEKQVQSKATSLGLLKTKEFMCFHAAKTAFRKGSVPANKGKKLTRAQYKKVSHTFFKKGHLPHNAIGFKNGHITIRNHQSKRKYKWIRLGLGKWYPLHQYKWDKKYGKPPKGYCLWFRDGDTMNCSLKNLELITRAENYRRNSASKNLTDLYVAHCIIGSNSKNKDILPEILKDKKLLEAKRQQLILKRTINDTTANSKKTGNHEGKVLRIRQSNPCSEKLHGGRHQRKVRA